MLFLFVKKMSSIRFEINSFKFKLVPKIDLKIILEKKIFVRKPYNRKRKTFFQTSNIFQKFRKILLLVFLIQKLYQHH